MIVGEPSSLTRPRDCLGLSYRRAWLLVESVNRSFSEPSTRANVGGIGGEGVQVKRSVTFAPADPVFKDVVEQVARAAGTPHFWTTRHELAVATAHTSHRLRAPYDVRYRLDGVEKTVKMDHQ